MQNQPVLAGSFAFSGIQSASNRTPRQMNRNLLFNIIRTAQPISRAELSRRSGLRRSTVSLIVEELIRERWIIKTTSGKLPRGRRPILIKIDDSRCVIAVDIHPSRTTIAIANMAGQIDVKDLIVPTMDSDTALAEIEAGIHAIVLQHPEKIYIGVGIALPGRTDPDLKSLIFAPRLHWPVVDLKAHIEQATGLPVEMDNVANGCALAEVWFGNSHAHEGLIVVNVSEGIAVGIFVNGRILRGYQGMAGEFGHVQLQAEDGVLCACGGRGCWETLASNTAALRYYQETTGENSSITFDELLLLALKGEGAAVQSLTRMAVALGSGIRTLLSALSPREVVIVGDIAAAWHLLGPIVEAEMRKGFVKTLPMIRCTGDAKGSRLRGAIALTLSKITL